MGDRVVYDGFAAGEEVDFPRVINRGRQCLTGGEARRSLREGLRRAGRGGGGEGGKHVLISIRPFRGDSFGSTIRLLDTTAAAAAGAELVKMSLLLKNQPTTKNELRDIRKMT